MGLQSNIVMTLLKPNFLILNKIQSFIIIFDCNADKNRF